MRLLIPHRVLVTLSAAALAVPAIAALAKARASARPAAAPDLAPIKAEIAKQHAEGVKRLQDWIKLPTIAAEKRNLDEGVEHMMQLLREAGFRSVSKVPTDGVSGVFATLDAGAPRTVGIYYMYDVKQFDPAEWSSPSLEAALVDKPGFGKVIVGRGAVNRKGPESAALHAIRGAGRKPPVNIVLVAEGEEEIGSPHFAQVVRKPEVADALRRTRARIRATSSLASP